MKRGILAGFFFIVWSVTSEPLDLNQLAQNIKQWGLELGFQRVGIADTDLSEAEPKLQAWLDKQYHGEVDQIAHHGMTHVRSHELLPSTLRVISVRMDYLPTNTAFASALKNPSLGYVNRYTLSHGYHKLLRNRLKRLGEMIQQRCVSLGFKLFVDSAPILERPLTEKTRLDWTGKHSLILNRRAGSFFFLGELLIDSPLPIDRPTEERCGKCVACMTICPTGAIVEPYTVDTCHCISYLTTKLEGMIPEELHPLMGNRIYDCNDCQLICPWNRYSQLTTEGDFNPRKQLHAPGLMELFSWSEAWFLKVTEGSAIRRIGHLRWLRSTAVALGNTPWNEAILCMSESRGGEHPLLDEHIKWAVAQQIGKRNAYVVEVQLPKKQRLIRVVEKGLPRDAQVIHSLHIKVKIH